MTTIRIGPRTCTRTSPRETGGTWSASTSLYLGPLKATNGSFNYEIPAAADLASSKSVVAWCRAFSVLTTWADLEAP